MIAFSWTKYPWKHRAKQVDKKIALTLVEEPKAQPPNPKLHPHQVKKEIVPTLLENYKVWPAAQVLTFGVIPLRLQLLFVNLVAVWWNSVLSLTQHKKEPVKPKGKWGRK